MAKRSSRRSLFKYAFATLGTIIAPAADLVAPEPTDEGYVVVDRRSLASGGVGLFLAVPGASSEELRKLAERLDEQFKDVPNVMAEIFDDATAARTVRTGSRVVGETAFADALTHQRATYRKTAKPPGRVLTIKGEPPETSRY